MNRINEPDIEDMVQDCGLCSHCAHYDGCEEIDPLAYDCNDYQEVEND